MTEYLKHILEGRASIPAWILVVMFMLFMLGSTGMQRVFDRYLPPPTAHQVDKIAESMTQQSDMIRLIRKNQVRLQHHNQRLVQLEQWRRAHNFE